MFFAVILPFQTALGKELSDEILYQGLLRNDSYAFEYLYKKNYTTVRQQIIQRGGDEDDAKDIFQEGIIALWKNTNSGTYTIQGNAKMSTYLIQICKLKWMDKLKKASSRYEVKKEDYFEPSEEATILTEWQDQDQLVEFQKNFAQLGERCQEILQRFYFKKESLQEIAATLGLGDATAKNEKYRCMQRLKKICSAQL